MKNRFAVGAVALALLTPVAAQAQNFQFQCPGCTTTGSGLTDYLYEFTVDPAQSFDIWYAGTATGDINLTFYTAYDAETGLGTTVYLGPLSLNNPNAQPNTLLGTYAFAADTYYVGAAEVGSDTPCTQGGGAAQGCNVVVKLRDAGSGTPDSTVPEPASMLLLGTGLALLGRYRRRSKQA